jgi:TPR repeat protein
MYANGQGVPQDYVQAVSWYRKAAEQGDADAQFGLGTMYFNGRGVPQDYAQAVSWFRKAAAQGDAKAQNSLGVMYANGQGVPQDAAIAYALYNLSATNDPSSDNPATANRARVSARMTPSQLAEGQALTRRMLSMGVLNAIDSWR